MKLLCRRNVRKALVRAAQQETTHVDDANWLLKTLSRTFAIMARPLGRMYAVVHELEQAALRMFALGEEAEIDFKGLPIEGLDRNLALVVKVRRTKNPRTSYAFPCRTVRDWFIARMLAHGGERDLLTRYNFPQEYVLQFLAVIAPDVAALATADRAEELRHEIESQVERQVQLTLGHQLNRSVGALLSNLRSVDRALGAAQVDDNARIAMERIREELAHLRRLTDRSRMLYESSAWDLASLALARFVHDVVLPLREQHARVEVTVDVAPELHVRAADEGLREILHCLIENACHSVCGRAADLPARVEVRGQRLGETVEVRVTDNGLGVSKEHQERIFEPFVTTKKGGAGGLRGTGLGLSIARRFATRMGARVTLESSNGTTTFVATFVAGEPT